MRNWRVASVPESRWRMTSKTYREFAASIIEALESLGLQYAIGGSFASSTYGEARTTMDIDISVALPESEMQRFVEVIQRWDQLLAEYRRTLS
jgi:hypothetical protein